MGKTKKIFPVWCLIAWSGLGISPVSAQNHVSDYLKIGVEPLPPVQPFNPYEGLR